MGRRAAVLEQREKVASVDDPVVGKRGARQGEQRREQVDVHRHRVAHHTRRQATRKAREQRHPLSALVGLALATAERPRVAVVVRTIVARDQHERALPEPGGVDGVEDGADASVQIFDDVAVETAIGAPGVLPRREVGNVREGV